MRSLFYLITAFFFCTSTLYAQDAKLQGYVYESGNRGYLNLVKVTIYEESSNAILTEVYSNKEGIFTATLPIDKNFRLKLEKSVFETKEERLSTVGKKWEEKVFTRVELKRKPGYLFDVTMARKRKKGEEIVDGIEGALIEVYNNTKEEEAMVLKDYPHPNFKVSFEQGNHYTVMIRKEGYFNKRMEAFVNIEGCILCFEGVGNVQPGVSEVLTEGNTMGTLLANVELDPIELNKGIKIENIYYDLDKADIRNDAAKELDKLVGVLKDNPALIIELGSHTDARGRDSYNLKLSKRRAESAVKYITSIGGIEKERIVAKGYGEIQLVNKCKNGVDCSERRHQQNRRTELKIVGIQEVDVYSSKSLADIMEEEKFERMLAEISNSEVVKIEAGEELPESIQKEIKEEGKPVVLEEVKEEKETAVAETKPVVEKPAVKIESKPVDQTLAVVAPDDRKSEPVIPPASASSVTKNDYRQETEIVEHDQIGEFRSDSEEFGANDPVMDGGKIVKEKEVKIERMGKKPLSLPDNYGGYRIEFFTSPYELPLSHEIFSQHGRITMEQRKDGSYAYLLGDFEEWRDANKFLNSIILSRYPSARVVRYKRGNRIN